jgi:hypothetical protein
MKKGWLTASVVFACLFLYPARSFSQLPTELKVDPLLLVSLKECRNIMKTCGPNIFPEWDFQKTAVLFYKPNVQELLIGFPHKPQGFSEFAGISPLTGETVYYRDGTTTLTVDDQNTSIPVEGISVLVVADPLSRMRNQIRGVLMGRPKEFALQWLEDWNFAQSPYRELLLILHEGFHVFQHLRAPNKWPNEMALSKYPLLDPVNNTFFVLEGNILRDAFLAAPSLKLEKIKQFVTVRYFRQSRLDPECSEYENLIEYSEGLAKYVEYKFLALGERIEPLQEMYYRQGFHGYQGVLAKLLEDSVGDMVKIVAVSDDRFGNKFGTGPLRFKLYELGAFQALLLDEVMPSWKEKVFENGVSIGGLLIQALRMPAEEMEQYLNRVKQEYKYDEVLAEKIQFEKEGKRRIQEKLDAILHSDRTLVRIIYGGFTEKLAIAFTPFGVTWLSEKSAIYDMVPVKVIFKEGAALQLKKIIPVLIDKEKKEILFVVAGPASKFLEGEQEKVDTDEFALSGAKISLRQEGKDIRIELK